MSYLNCVFCEAEVTSPPVLNDSTAKGICEFFVARCGRLPRMDEKGMHIPMGSRRDRERQLMKPFCYGVNKPLELIKKWGHLQGVHLIAIGPRPP